MPSPRRSGPRGRRSSWRKISSSSTSERSSCGDFASRRHQMADQEMARSLERYGKLLREAETHVDYWMAGPVIEFTEDLCRIMKEKRVSRAELARRVGTSRAYVTQLLGGGANFTLQTMVKLAMALDGAVHIHISDKRAISRWRDKAPRKAAKKTAKKAAKKTAKPRRSSAAEAGSEA